MFRTFLASGHALLIGSFVFFPFFSNLLHMNSRENSPFPQWRFDSPVIGFIYFSRREGGLCERSILSPSLLLPFFFSGWDYTRPPSFPPWWKLFSLIGCRRVLSFIGLCAYLLLLEFSPPSGAEPLCTYASLGASRWRSPPLDLSITEFALFLRRALLFYSNLR